MEKRQLQERVHCSFTSDDNQLRVEVLDGEPENFVRLIVTEPDDTLLKMVTLCPCHAREVGVILTMAADRAAERGRDTA